MGDVDLVTFVSQAVKVCTSPYNKVLLSGRSYYRALCVNITLSSHLILPQHLELMLCLCEGRGCTLGLQVPLVTIKAELLL